MCIDGWPQTTLKEKRVCRNELKEKLMGPRELMGQKRESISEKERERSAARNSERLIVPCRKREISTESEKRDSKRFKETDRLKNANV